MVYYTVSIYSLRAVFFCQLIKIIKILSQCFLSLLPCLFQAFRYRNGNLSNHSLQHSVNSAGIFFKGGEDLDTFTEPGTWNCNSYGTAQSLIHTPPIGTFGSGFRFDVFASSSGGRVQRIMVHDTIPKIFYRSKFSDTWNNWEKVVSNTDLTERFKPIRIFGTEGGTFSKALKNKVYNSVVFLAFDTSVPDNPFSFEAGYAIAFHAGLLKSENVFTLIGFDSNALHPLEIKMLDLRS